MEKYVSIYGQTICYIFKQLAIYLYNLDRFVISAISEIACAWMGIVDRFAIWRVRGRIGANLPCQNLAGTMHPVAAVVYWDDPYNGEFAVDLASHNEPLLSSRKMTATLASSFSRLWVSRLLDGSFICVVHPQMVISNGWRKMFRRFGIIRHQMMFGEEYSCVAIVMVINLGCSDRYDQAANLLSALVKI